MPNKLKVICINNCADQSTGTSLLTMGEEYFVDGERENPEDTTQTAYTIEGIDETCDCCGERICFPKEAFIPLN